MARGRRKTPFKLKLKKHTLYTISSVCLFSLAAIIVFSFSRQGVLLSKIYAIEAYYLGIGAFFLPFVLVVAGMMLVRLQWKITRPNVFVGSLILAIAIMGLFRSGLVGFQIWHNLAILISSFGAVFVLLGFVFIGLVIIFNTSLEEIILYLARIFAQINRASNTLRKVSGRRKLAAEPELKVSGREKEIREKQRKGEELAPSLVSNLPAEEGVWEFPPLSLLADEVGGKADRGDIKKNADLIEKTLESFGIAARVAEVNLGPAVTQYALEIALGTKLSKITTLANDLALALAAPTGQIRIEAPIPGRSLVGIEVPNRSPEFVTLKQMLTADKMVKAKSKLTVPLGLNVSGEPVVDNLSRMPHVLIAGATGSGKTCAQNTFVITEKGMLTFKELYPLPLNKEKEVRLKVASRDGVEETSRVYNNGVCDFFEIKTEEGFKIEVTGEHPLWVMKKDGEMDWKEGVKIKPGDYVAISRGNNLFGKKTDLSDFVLEKDIRNRVPLILIPRKMTIDLARFLGFLVADGDLSVHNRIVYTQLNRNFLDIYKNLLEKLFGLNRFSQAKSGSSQAKDIVVRNKYLRDFLSYLGLGIVKSKDKEVPKSIRQAPKEMVIAFLQAMMEHDAHIAENHLELTVASYNLAHQVQLILLNLGIVSSIKIKRVRGYEKNQYFRLLISGDDYRNYIHEVGFIRKRNYLKTQKFLSLISNPNKDVIPHLGGLLNDLKREYRQRFAQLTNQGWQYLKEAAIPKYKFAILKNYNVEVRFPTYSMLGRIIDFYQPVSDSSSYTKIKMVNEKKFFWSKVAKIGKSQGEGYDFEVPGSNSFVGNGFVNHNSVCINSFIAAILFRASPAEVKLILVDPKRVELTQYNGLPHLLTPVIVDPEKVVSALKWAISEMDRRYKLFAEVGVRNIEGYNELSGFSALPYILIIVDELADIMLFAPTEVEDVICRIAQMARATGIHLVISTQRPSVDVITGLIKANIPCRIAFNVSSQIDSRVIIDMPGAEKLLGRGDMLYIPPDQAKPTRIQGTLVSEPEIQKLINFLRKTGVAPQYTEEVTKVPTKVSTAIGEMEERDELFEDSVRTVCRYDRASASLLQRRLKVGYARAARIIDQLERAGVVGPAEGSKPREVLIQNPEEYLASQIASQSER